MPDFWMRMEKADAGLTERATVLRDHVFSDGALPRCTKAIHARRALEHGATPAQVQEAVALSVVAAGIPAYREAIKLLWDTLWPELPRPAGP